MRRLEKHLRIVAGMVAALFSSLIMLGILRNRKATAARAAHLPVEPVDPAPAPPRPSASTLPSRIPHAPPLIGPSPVEREAPTEDPPPPAPPPIRFNTLLLVLGLLFTLVIGVDLLLRGSHRFPQAHQWTVPGGEASRGRDAIIAHGCGGCHVVPGIRTATGRVGPQLRDFRQQVYIAGRLPNQWENLVQWIQNPQHIDPANAMPNLNLTEAEARDIAAYLYSVR
jgi:cytochrome c